MNTRYKDLLAHRKERMVISPILVTLLVIVVFSLGIIVYILDEANKRVLEEAKQPKNCAERYFEQVEKNNAKRIHR